MDNAELVKAALASSDLSAGGYLNAEQSEKFIRGVIAQPTILKDCRNILITGETKKIEKIGFGSRIMKAAVENTALASSAYSKPTTGKVELATKEVIAEVRISYDTLENNIEGQNLKNTIVSMIQERVALDLEELAINGDDDNASDTYLAVTDGWLKQITTNRIDLQGAAGVSVANWGRLIASVDPKYRRVPSQWKIYTTSGVDLYWKEQIAARNTVAGDRFLLDNSPASALGYQIIPVAMMPTARVYTPAEGAAVTGLHCAILTHPQNLIAGYTRRVQIETDKDISARQIIIVVTCKVDFAIEEELAVGLLDNIDHDYVAG